jgi:dCMP deaminase
MTGCFSQNIYTPMKYPVTMNLNSTSRWDMHWLNVADAFKLMSKDPSTKVGAVLAKNKELISAGFNGLPSSIEDTHDILHNREKKLELVVHAEMNAILRAGMNSHGCDLFIAGFAGPCIHCCKHIVAAGIKRVVVYKNIPTADRWKESLKGSQDLLEKSGVKFDAV